LFFHQVQVAFFVAAFVAFLDGIIIGGKVLYSLLGFLSAALPYLYRFWRESREDE
jgi:hypothetical protein